MVARALVYAAVGVDVALRPGTSFMGDLTSWDANWYLSIVTGGYPAQPPSGQNATAFFPLYPLVVRAIAAGTPLTAVTAAIAVSLLGGLVATWVVWILVRDHSGPEAATRAATLFALFPASYVFNVPYSEGLMIALAAGCLLALDRRRWLLAGVLGALATATRPNAVGVIVAAGVAAGIAIASKREWRALAAPALAPLGLLAFMVFLRIHTGDLLMGWHTQQAGWGQRLDFGWTTVRAVGTALTDPIDNFNRVALTFALVVTAGGCWVLWRAREWVQIAYVAGVMGPVLAASSVMSRPRFVLAAFPIVLALGVRARAQTYVVMVAGSAALLTLATLLTLSALWLVP